MRTYSIDSVEVAWNNLDFKEGLAAGSSIAAARNTVKWSTVPTGQGKVTRVRNPDDSGTVTFLLDQTSKLHQQFMVIAEAEKIPGSAAQVFPLKVTDTSSGEVRTFINAFIMTDPDFARGTEAVTFAWVFAFEDYAVGANTNNTQNLVGS